MAFSITQVFSFGSLYKPHKKGITYRQQFLKCRCSQQNDPQPQNQQQEPNEDQSTNQDQQKNSFVNEQQIINIDKEDVQTIRSSVLGFDTFFATNVENYAGGGVLFTGNLKTQSQNAFSKMNQRIKDKFGNKYELYLLADPEQEGAAVVVVLPESSIKNQRKEANWKVAIPLAFVTLLTTFNANGLPIFASTLSLNFSEVNLDKFGQSLPGAIAFIGSIFAHEIGHILTAKSQQIGLGLPLLIPSGLGLLGSFGGITSINPPVTSRQQLAEVSGSGPLAGSLFSLIVLLVGMILTKAGMGGVALSPAAFQDSFLVQSIALVFFGDQGLGASGVGSQQLLQANPLLLAGWAGLIMNAINSIPAGELDGGRVALSLFGRKISGTISVISLVLLGVGALGDSLSQYWLLLVLILQRGPIPPVKDEITEMDVKGMAISIGVLLLPLLVLLPFPVFPDAMDTF
eukprot:TRINITY_DN27455_c0_g1_i1.p1 TRINITY_DN27455_c0_g1~~TRINITY_DN27455_c0_g1_i1.p1  ORF type:complete len:458 (-),score=53.69 TRINITY_DN27455_c0_g1_i1:402-1775(-)